MIKVSKILIKRNKFIIDFDNFEKILTTANTLASYRVHIDKEFDENTFQSFKRDSELGILHQKCLDILYRKKVNRSQLKRKIDIWKRKVSLEFEDNIWSAELQRLEDLQLLNEGEMIITDIQKYLNKGKGKNYIKNKLLEKGYNRSDITLSLSEIEEDLEIIQQLLEKKYDSLKEKYDKRKSKEHLFRFGLSRGYDPKKVTDAIKRIFD